MSRSSKLVNQGMILGETEYHRLSDRCRRMAQRGRRGHGRRRAADRASPRASRCRPCGLKPDDVTKHGELFVLKADPAIRIDSRAYKMSKSRGNVVNPDQVVAEYGADSLRLYEMFMGPLEAVKPWSM